MTINVGGGELRELKPRILVIGVGGAGGNAINAMIDAGMQGVEFVAVNTDAQDLRVNKADSKIQIGMNLTKGLGAGADPEKGRQAALEAKEELSAAISGADMLFIAAGMGGGTGTGAAPVIAQLARDAGILTVAVVSKPYEFEGVRRTKHAEEGIAALSEWVDSLIVIPNEKLAEVYGSDDSIFSSFDNANDVLRGAVKGIAEIITIRGHINVDFADVKTVMSGRGKAMMGSAVASGDNRATEAVEKALSSPLLDNMHLKNATGVLCNITAGADLKQSEFNLIGQKVKEIAGEDATTIIGCIKEDENVGELRVTLIATGFDNNEELSVDDDHVNYQNPNNLSSGISNANINKTFTTNPLDNTNVLSTEEPIIENDKINVNDVEVPAFLRQQAD